ncbi:MAG TPA: nuclear transport factor 2 family protein [Chitinophagaceae bacterium]|nr:nuclear transport factor 2 family protein [Chitinophagaceae bacterium]
MRKLIFLVAAATIFISCKNEKPVEDKAATSVSGEAKEPAPAEFADMKYADVGKNAIAALASGDIDAFVASYADNAVYVWNSGDSLTGKENIKNYWKKRRTEVIDSLSFTNAIWLPIKVNKPQTIEAPGVWLLGWYQVSAKYKSGKKMSQWIHMDYHFNADDKIDRVIQYIDRVLINEATKK